MIRRSPIRRRVKPRRQGMDYSKCAIGKPVKRKRIKARRARQEGKVIATERPKCVARDGYCRIVRDSAMNAALFGACDGASEWSHYNTSHRRSKTSGMPPEYRHDAKYSMMLCHKHSEDYDQHRLDIEIRSASRGCDGPLRFTKGPHVYKESA